MGREGGRERGLEEGGRERERARGREGEGGGNERDTGNYFLPLTPSYEAELNLWRSGHEVSEEERKKFASVRSASRESSMESVKSTPFSSPQGTPTKSFSPTPQEYQEERTRLNGIIEEKVVIMRIL